MHRKYLIFKNWFLDYKIKYLNFKINHATKKIINIRLSALKKYARLIQKLGAAETKEEKELLHKILSSFNTTLDNFQKMINKNEL